MLEHFCMYFNCAMVSIILMHCAYYQFIHTFLPGAGAGAAAKIQENKSKNRSNHSKNMIFLSGLHKKDKA